MKRRFTWRILFYSVLLIILILVIRPAVFLLSTYYQDRKPVQREQQGYINDASRLNNTHIQQRIAVKHDVNEAITQLAGMIKSAAKNKQRISIAGARHTMGGHTIFNDGIVLDMKGMNHLHYDSISNTLIAGSGARWSEIIPFLDSRGKSVAIMQSNNSFTVGGSISANCHGWTPNLPPIASSVKWLRLVNAKGELLTCSRSENAELFSLVAGGYGLFGVIIDVGLEVVDNKIYKPEQYVIASDDYVNKFKQLVKDKKEVGMAYGRISITKEHFMEEAIISVYTSIDTNLRLPLSNKTYPGLRRTVFRGSVNSDYGKQLRWRAEKALTKVVGRKLFSRNQLLNEGVEVFENTDTAFTDILHEYFLPVDSATGFIQQLKTIIPAYEVDLLNITLRDVKKDKDSFLAYAQKDVIGFVMLFNQAREPVAEKKMQQLTSVLIETAHSLGGSYYLPYRLHASSEQFNKAYPEAAKFFALKKTYDPEELFQNKFYQRYK
jgi:FAD/FMN-containing dehydrogenase